MSLVKVGTQYVNPTEIESVAELLPTRRTVVQLKSGRSVITSEPLDTIVDRINHHLEES